MNWKIEKDEQGFHITDDANFSDIAVVYDEKYVKLLNAAPELLEALRNIVECWNADVLDSNDINSAMVAIEKAIGE